MNSNPMPGAMPVVTGHSLAANPNPFASSASANTPVKTAEPPAATTKASDPTPVDPPFGPPKPVEPAPYGGQSQVRDEDAHKPIGAALPSAPRSDGLQEHKPSSLNGTALSGSPPKPAAEPPVSGSLFGAPKPAAEPPVSSSSFGAPKPAAETAFAPKPAEPASFAPKPAIAEQGPDKDAPLDATATEPLSMTEPDTTKSSTIDAPAAKETAAPASGLGFGLGGPASSGASEPVKQSVEPSKPTPEASATPKEPVIDKPAGVNGSAPTQGLEMAGALKGSESDVSAPAASTSTAPAAGGVSTASASTLSPAPAPATTVPAPAPAPAQVSPSTSNQAPAAVSSLNSQPAPAGEREPAPQAISPAEKQQDLGPSAAESGANKRKADELDAPADSGIGGDAVDDSAANKKRKPGRPPSTANGGANGEKESLGQKIVKKAKKVLPPVGKTARKTRSQGPA